MWNQYERKNGWRRDERDKKQRTIVTVGGTEASWEVGNVEGADEVVGTVDGFDVGVLEGEEEGLSSFSTQ